MDPVIIGSCGTGSLERVNGRGRVASAEVGRAQVIKLIGEGLRSRHAFEASDRRIHITLDEIDSRQEVHRELVTWVAAAQLFKCPS